MLSTGVAGRVFNTPAHATSEALARRFLTSTHLAPSFVSRGGSTIRAFPISDRNRESAITKILPTFAAIPDALAPVETLRFRR